MDEDKLVAIVAERMNIGRFLEILVDFLETILLKGIICCRIERVFCMLSVNGIPLEIRVGENLLA